MPLQPVTKDDGGSNMPPNHARRVAIRGKREKKALDPRPEWPRTNLSADVRPNREAFQHGLLLGDGGRREETSRIMGSASSDCGLETPEANVCDRGPLAIPRRFP